MRNLIALLLELGCHVLFWARDAAGYDDYSTALERMGVEIVPVSGRRGELDWWYRHGGELDVVMLSRVAIAHACNRMARRYATSALRVFDTVDLHFLRVSRGAALLQDARQARWAEKLRGIELSLIRRTDVTLVVSERERDILRGMADVRKVKVLSNIQPLHGRTCPFDARAGLLFLGNFAHEPNVDAARWLVSEIMPQLRRQCADRIVLHIVGHGAAAALGESPEPDVVIHDFVADLEPFFASVRIALAPLRYGAGVKGKINLAMSHGVPVVSTTIGAEGMALNHGHDVMVADGPDDFAAAIATLYDDSDLWLRLSENGLDNVRRHFSADAARGVLDGLLARASA